MKKFIIIPIFIVLLHGNLFAEGPTNDWDPSYELQPKQEKKDKNIWMNMLAYYKKWRDKAKEQLETMKRVSEMLLAANTYLKSVDRLSQHADHAWKTLNQIAHWRVDNFGDLIDLVETTNEDFFTYTEHIRLNDVPRIRQARKELKDTRNAIFEGGLLGKEKYKKLRAYLTNYDDVAVQYAEISQITSADDKVYENSHDPRNKRYILSTHTGVETMAASDFRQLDIETQSLLIANLMKEAGQDSGEVVMSKIVDAKEAKEKNSVLLNIQENDYIHDAIRILCQEILHKVVDLDDMLSQKSLFIAQMENIADAIEKYEQKKD